MVLLHAEGQGAPVLTLSSKSKDFGENKILKEKRVKTGMLIGLDLSLKFMTIIRPLLLLLLLATIY
jgi:hypothetical protein